MKTAKYRGVVYEVKPTGNKIHTPSKSYYDFNGYWTEKPAETRQQLGLYEDGKLVFTVGKDGKSIFTWNGKHGEVCIRDTENDPYAHALITALNK